MTACLHPPAPLLPVTVAPSWLLPPHTLGQGERHDSEHAGANIQRANPTISLPPPGPCPPGGMTTFIVFDESASVAAGGGNDPLSRRYDEAMLAIRHVAGACVCHRNRVGLVSFDARFTGCVVPQPLTSAGLRRLQRGLARFSEQQGTSSDLGPALRQVELAARTRRRSPVALVVFSDFLLTDRDPGAVLLRLRNFPGYVHAVVLGASPPEVLVAEQNVAVTRLTLSSPPGEAAWAVFDGLNHYRCHRSPALGSAVQGESHHDDGKEQSQ